MYRSFLKAAVLVLLIMECQVFAQDIKKNALRVNWQSVVATSRSTPTLQVVVNPELKRDAKLHDSSFRALRELGANYVRYVPWLPYPRLAVAELQEPKDRKTSWDFSQIDPMLEDFVKATEGHSVVLNFSTIPAWMFKTDKPVKYPDDPDQVFWSYTQGTELRDPTMKEISGYYARLLSWYTKGGFIDEYGKRHESGHHYRIPYWEVLNEIDLEHHWTAEQYTKFYDAVTVAMRKVDPNIKFMGLSFANTDDKADMFEYFLNPSNHRAQAPLDFISYHFYATPGADQTIDHWQYTFYDQAAGFLAKVRYIESIRKRYSPSTKTALNELGVILPGDPSGRGRPEPKAYWNLAAAMYAHLYIELTKLGVEVVGESQLVGYPSQFPSVSMMDYDTGRPNARFWVLKLLRDNFGPGDKLVGTEGEDADLDAQAFLTTRGKRILLVNKHLKTKVVLLPTDFNAATITRVAPSTGDNPPECKLLPARTITLEPNEVAVLSE